MAFHDFIPFILVAFALVQGLIGFIVRDAMKRIDTLLITSAEHGTKIAVLSDPKLQDKADDHEARLRALEAGLRDMQADVKYIREAIDGISRRRGK